MTAVQPWFERTFDFSFPISQCPNLRARLRGTPARVEELLHGAARDILTRKPDGKWSAQEHAGHLLDLEPLWRARVEDFLKGGDELTAADLRNRKTEEANHNARPLDELLGAFRAARVALLDRVESLDSQLFVRTRLHPRLKTPMRMVDHLYFAAEHDDHHLAHIWQLLRA